MALFWVSLFTTPFGLLRSFRLLMIVIGVTLNEAIKLLS